MTAFADSISASYARDFSEFVWTRGRWALKTRDSLFGFRPLIYYASRLKSMSSAWGRHLGGWWSTMRLRLKAPRFSIHSLHTLVRRATCSSIGKLFLKKKIGFYLYWNNVAWVKMGNTIQLSEKGKDPQTKCTFTRWRSTDTRTLNLSVIHMLPY